MASVELEFMDPNDQNIDYLIKLGPWLAPGEFIIYQDAPVSNDPLVVVEQYHILDSSKLLTFISAGGSEGNKAEIRLRYTTNSDPQKRRDFTFCFKIKHR